MVRMDIFSIRRSLALLLLFILSISGWHGQLVAAFTTEGTLTYTTAQHTEIQGGEGGLFGNGIIKSGSTAPRAAISAAPTPQRTSPPPGLDPDAAYTLPTNSININQPDLNCPTPTPSTITTTETIKGGLAVSDHSIYITSYLTTSISVTKTVLHNGTICPDIDDGSSSGSSGGVQDDAYPPPYICPMHVLLHNPVSIIGCDNPDAQIVMSATMTTDELGGQGGFLVGTYLTTMKLTQRANDQDGGGNTAAGGEVDLNTVPAPCQVQVQVPSPCVQATTTSTVAVTITTTVNVVVTTTLPHAFNAIVSTMTLLTTVPIATFVSTKTETVVEVSSLGCADGVDVGSQGTTITNVSPNGLPSVLTITSTGREVFTTVTELVGAAARPSHNGLLSVLTVTSAGREVFTTVTGPGVSAATPSLLLVTVNGTPIVYRSERDISPITQAGVAGSGSDVSHLPII